MTSVNKKLKMAEAIENHKTLNKKLFNSSDLLKNEVSEHILKIVDTFVEELENDSIDIVIKDIILIGSNASYNYNSKSDLDVHIVADTKSLNCPKNLYPKLYSAYRSIFNKNFDITFFDIPVELFVETEDIKTVSNGIYSVKNNEWIKHPKHEQIPEIDTTALNKNLKIWTDKSEKLLKKIKENTKSSQLVDQIDLFLEDIYNLRKTSISTEGEYSIGNLVFKELRNNGTLDKLKEAKYNQLEKILTLEAFHKKKINQKLVQYSQDIENVTQYTPQIQNNGYFYIYNVPDHDVDTIIQKLKNLSFVTEAKRGTAAGYNFSKPYWSPNNSLERNYAIIGKINLN